MTSEQLFDEKGKVRPKPGQETAEPQKSSDPLTMDQIQGSLDPSTLTHMQKTMGNTAVQRFLAQRSGAGPAELDEEISSTINSRRGSGHSLDETMARKAGGTLGQDFDDVKIHTDGQADQLSRQLGAKAFTTGHDIFFREGAYDPASREGQHLISHELTHVVQQGAAAPVQGKMSVNDPDDQYEAEADQVADAVMSQDNAAVHRQELEEEEEMLQMQADEEEEEEMLQMQPIEEEEEELQP
ncbi:MAG: DUF4157 domain-containing protein [Anaerolineae bacterium]